LLNISRTHLYYKAAPPSPREVAIKHRSDELFTAAPFYGSRRLLALLEPEFAPLARNTVRRYMREAVLDRTGAPQRCTVCRIVGCHSAIVACGRTGSDGGHIPIVL